MKNYILPLVIGLTTLNAHAESIPVSQGADNRIKQVVYQSNEVFLIQAKPGIATNIVLEPDEVYLNHAFGDSEAWTFAYYGNNVFVKPKMPNGDTNLVLITNKRTYNFYLHYNQSNSVYQVKFIYPDTERKKVEENRKTALLDNAFKGKNYNLSYDAKGDQSLMPVNVWDDGKFTYFKFSGNTDLPAIYAVIKTEEGTEALVNRTVMGKSNNIIVMHKVNPEWRLRLGNAVLNIYNKNMNWIGIENTTGTVSDQVERKIIGGNENE